MSENLSFGILGEAYEYRDPASGFQTKSMKELLRKTKATEFRFSEKFLENLLEGVPNGKRCLIDGYEKVGTAVRPPPSPVRDLESQLSTSFQSLGSSNVAIALSGGFDSRLLASWARHHGKKVEAFCLRTDIGNYCEWSEALSIANSLDIRCTPIHAKAEDFVEALADFVAVTEMPIYNLHAVSKLLLARGLKKLGAQTVVSGDGADQVLRGDQECDLFPLTVACFQNQEVQLVTPFATWDLKFWVEQQGRSLYKEALMPLAQKMNLAMPAKHSRYFPALLPTVQRDRRFILEKSLALLKSHLQEGLPCVASPEL